jgi:hypothetical protein
MADLATGKRIDLPPGLRDCKGYVGGFSGDGRTLVTFADNVVTLWAWPAGQARLAVNVGLAKHNMRDGKTRGNAVGVRTVALAPNGSLLFTNSIQGKKGKSGGSQNANDVWDARTGKHLHRLTAPEPWYPPAAFSPDSQVMYLGGHSLFMPDRKRQSDALTAWDPLAGRLLSRIAEVGKLPLPGNRGQEWGIQALAVSPDGRLLAAAEEPLELTNPLTVILYETATGRVLAKRTGHAGWVNDLAFTPDGRRLVSVSHDQTGLVWDMTVPALGGTPTPGGLRKAWEELASSDPVPAYAGMAALVAAPAQAVRLLREKLRPAAVPSAADLDRLVKRLDADTLAERERATTELERFGPNAIAGVKTRLTRTTAAEVRRRLTRFLRRHDRRDEPPPYYLQCVRGVAALEGIGTPEAREWLAHLAKGPAHDPLTREARAALRRDTSK